MQKRPSDIVRLLANMYSVPETSVVSATVCRNGRPVFIVYSDSYTRVTRTVDFGHDVIIKNPKDINGEAKTVTHHCDKEGIIIGTEELKILQRGIAENAKEWFGSHSNLNILSVSPVKSKQQGDQISACPCIVFYCSSKGYIPFPYKEFPRTVEVGDERVAIDVREGYFRFTPFIPPRYIPIPSNLFHHRLRMGCSFGVETIPKFAGTVGPFVEYESEIAFLTCAHIIYGVDPKGYDFANPKIYIEQPPTSFSHRSQNRCGEVIKAVFKPNSNTSIDAALVLITDQQRLPKKGQFAIDNEDRYRDSGFDDMPVFNSGIVASHPNQGVNKRIVKFGASTHVTSGLLVCTGSVVRPLSHELQLYGNSQRILMQNQLEVQGMKTADRSPSQPDPDRFFKCGDSGAGVFYVDNSPAGQLTCIGMAIGSTSYGSAIVTPIKDVLSALKLPADTLLRFQ